jgi:hypothetical protein
MTALLVIVGGVVGLGLILGALSSKETRLFRRVWSTERMGGSYVAEKQAEAIDQLIARYGIKNVEDDQQMRKSIVGLMAAAATFDLKNPNNLGVEVAPVIARALRSRFPSIGA